MKLLNLCQWTLVAFIFIDFTKYLLEQTWISICKVMANLQLYSIVIKTIQRFLNKLTTTKIKLKIKLNDKCKIVVVACWIKNSI